MALVNITRKPSALQGYQLATPGDMYTALEYLSSRGYVGAVSCLRNGSGLLWQFSLQTNSGTGAQSGALGDWIVIENDSVASIVPAAKAAALYTVAA